LDTNDFGGAGGGGGGTYGIKILYNIFFYTQLMFNIFIVFKLDEKSHKPLPLIVAGGGGGGGASHTIDVKSVEGIQSVLNFNIYCGSSDLV